MVNLPSRREISGLHGVRSLFQGAILRLVRLDGLSVVSLIDLNSFKIIKTIGTGSGAHGVAVGADGRYAYVSNVYSNSVSVIDLQVGKRVKTVAVGRSPNGITVAP
jgi:YVTN family beta-propeller protein